MKNYIMSIVLTKPLLPLGVMLKHFICVAESLMTLKKKVAVILRALTIFVIASPLCSVAANGSSHTDLGPWAVLFYRGVTAKQVFGDVMLGKYSSFGETIYVAELAYTLEQNNLIQRFFRPVFDVVQIAGNVAYRHDYTNNDNVKEGNLYLIWRFSRFPWSNYLKNSIAIGDGVSYDSHPPFADREPNQPVANFGRLLNYLLLELTFALPSCPEFELALRVHHRCTAWGTFGGNSNAGSTNVGIGLRYYF